MCVYMGGGKTIFSKCPVSFKQLSDLIQSHLPRVAIFISLTFSRISKSYSRMTFVEAGERLQLRGKQQQQQQPRPNFSLQIVLKLMCGRLPARCDCCIELNYWMPTLIITALSHFLGPGHVYDLFFFILFSLLVILILCFLISSPLFSSPSPSLPRLFTFLLSLLFFFFACYSGPTDEISGDGNMWFLFINNLSVTNALACNLHNSFATFCCLQ